MRPLPAVPWFIPPITLHLWITVLTTSAHQGLCLACSLLCGLVHCRHFQPTPTLLLLLPSLQWVPPLLQPSNPGLSRASSQGGYPSRCHGEGLEDGGPVWHLSAPGSQPWVRPWLAISPPPPLPPPTTWLPQRSLWAWSQGQGQWEVNWAQLCFANRDFAPWPVTGDLLGPLSPAGEEARNAGGVSGQWAVSWSCLCGGQKTTGLCWKQASPNGVHSFPKACQESWILLEGDEDRLGRSLLASPRQGWRLGLLFLWPCKSSQHPQAPGQDSAPSPSCTNITFSHNLGALCVFSSAWDCFFPVYLIDMCEDQLCQEKNNVLWKQEEGGWKCKMSLYICTSLSPLPHSRGPTFPLPETNQPLYGCTAATQGP